MSDVEYNEYGQPIGFAVPAWRVPEHPPREPMIGRWCRLEPLDSKRHAADFYTAVASAADGRDFTYLPIAPFADATACERWAAEAATGDDPLFFAIVAHHSARALGVASYLRISPRAGSVEVGHINFSPALQRTAAATEAMYLMMKRVFELGYRRYEWKCDALNAPSRAAAQRLGMSYEGTFRQALVYKGRNRDTAWYAAIDRDWPVLEVAFTRWLDPANFDAAGRQRSSLATWTSAALERRG